MWAARNMILHATSVRRLATSLDGACVITFYASEALSLGHCQYDAFYSQRCLCAQFDDSEGNGRYQERKRGAPLETCRIPNTRWQSVNVQATHDIYEALRVTPMQVAQ